MDANKYRTAYDKAQAVQHEVWTELCQHLEHAPDAQLLSDYTATLVYTLDKDRREEALRLLRGQLYSRQLRDTGRVESWFTDCGARHRSHVVKTRMTEEEYADFTERLKHYDMSQAEFIRQAITRATIRPIVTVSPVNDELLSAIGKLIAEYGKIGGNLNQIARALNEYGTPYNTLSVEVRAAISDLVALKFEVLRKVGDAVANGILAFAVL